MAHTSSRNLAGPGDTEANSTGRPSDDRTARTGDEADSPTEIGVSGWKDVALRVKEEFNDDHVTLTAAGVAFFFFLALVPLLAAGVSLYGLAADPADVTSLVDRLGSNVPASISDLLREQLSSIATANSGALGLGLVIGLVTALWSASSGFTHLIEGFNIAYDETESRSFFVRRGLALAFTLGFLALIGTVIAVISIAAAFGSGVVAIVVLGIGWLVVAVLFGFFLAILYRYGPNRVEPEWQWVSPGAVVAVLAWTVMTIGFGLYISRFGSYNDTYGSLGAVIIVLTWMYFTAVVVVTGAEINTEAERQTPEHSTSDANQPGDQPIDQLGSDSADDLAAR